MGVPQAFQTGTLVRLAIGLNSIVKVGDELELYPKAMKLLANSNRACARILNGNAAPETKKKRLLAAQQGVMRDVKALLPEATWKKVVATGDAPKPGELVLKVKTLKLCPLDDPFGKTTNLGEGEDPFDLYIGETEKNLLRSAPLGGDMIIADTPF